MTQETLNTGETFTTKTVTEEIEIVTELNISHIEIEDDTPVDNFQSSQTTKAAGRTALRFLDIGGFLHCRCKHRIVLRLARCSDRSRCVFKSEREDAERLEPEEKSLLLCLGV